MDILFPLLFIVLAAVGAWAATRYVKDVRLQTFFWVVAALVAGVALVMLFNGTSNG